MHNAQGIIHFMAFTFEINVNFVIHLFLYNKNMYSEWEKIVLKFHEICHRFI